MTIQYRTDPPTEDGIYLLDVDGEFEVAEAIVDEDGSVHWDQLGIDYDVWTHGYPDTYDITVICKLDLEKIAQAAKGSI